MKKIFALILSSLILVSCFKEDTGCGPVRAFEEQARVHNTQPVEIGEPEIGETEIITCKEAVDLIKAGTQGTKTYYIKGIVCALIDISVQYSNATFWMSDNGVFNESDGQNLLVYRSTWLNGDKITTGDEIAVGDEIVVSGCLIDYLGTPETQEKTTTVVSINKS